jgi:hypothetical protein
LTLTASSYQDLAYRWELESTRNCNAVRMACRKRCQKIATGRYC